MLEWKCAGLPVYARLGAIDVRHELTLAHKQRHAVLHEKCAIIWNEIFNENKEDTYICSGTDAISCCVHFSTLNYGNG